ncbi:hypothetical protein KQ940_13230 [Marinobacterium sp. D7]|uniref:hypothetical protein n=1 Tax=Marinobacterium ramblicola TaxID=2849041 RepID=UPI001C2CD778|nr:hypothetical protein [Marinobacterium ramblicola]MBV1789014.1 hypothetical protein [Marinobacterium ramblicola]
MPTIEAVNVDGVYTPVRQPSRLRRLAAKATGAVTAVGSAMIAATPSWALDATQNTQISDAYSATNTTINLIIAGLLAAVLLITGFAIIYGLLKR